MADAEAEELTRQENLAYFQRIEQMLNEPEEDEVSLPPCGHWPIPIPLTRSIAPTCARSTGVIQPQPASRAAVGGEAKQKCPSAVAAIRPPPPPSPAYAEVLPAGVARRLCLSLLTPPSLNWPAG